LITGSSFGAVFGASFGQRIKKEYTKLILAFIVTTVALLSFYQLFFEKQNSVEPVSMIDNPISKFAYDNSSLYAILVIIVSIIFGTIISIISHRIKLFVEIQLDKMKVNN